VPTSAQIVVSNVLVAASSVPSALRYSANDCSLSEGDRTGCPIKTRAVESSMFHGLSLSLV
jgi:hypothetical protein